nr:unnamed protein product [Digitaria exilis]
MIERLSNSVTDLRDKRDKRTAVLTEQLQALEPLEAKCREDAARQEKIEVAFLGLKITGREDGFEFE